MRLLVLSDIHANLSALSAVLKAVRPYTIEKAVLLGDHIDYGMRPNETIALLKKLPFPVDANLWGNHEKAIIESDYSRFSSERGKEFSRFTAQTLNADSVNYINNEMLKDGYAVKTYNGKRFLLIHGGLHDTFWGSITPENTGDCYKEYDYVLSGHSHLPCCFEKYYASDNAEMRGKKRTVFVNPGSVGQPRNHNPRASCAVIDAETGSVHLNTAEYDVKAEQALYGGGVDEFYRLRLEKGI